MIAAGLLISVNNAVLKSISTTIPLGEVICLRALVSLTLIVGFVLARGQLNDLRVNQHRAHLSRGILQVGSMFLFIGALRALPLVDVMTWSISVRSSLRRWRRPSWANASDGIDGRP